ncbi:MAG: methyl-accepting chemotaxis protein [Anaerolineae bacterium]
MRKTVVTPLTLGFLIMGALMGLLLFMSLYYATHLYLDYQRIIGVYVVQRTATIRLQASLLTERWAASRYLISRDPSDRAEAEVARALADKYAAIVRDTAEEAEWNTFSAGYRGYHALLDGLLYYLSKENADPQVFEIAGQADDSLAELLEVATAIQDRSRGQIEENLESYHTFFQRGFMAVLGVGAGLMLFGAATGLTLTRSITLPLAQLTEASRRLGDGDLTAVPEIPTSNEIGALAASFRQMASSLGQAIERMRETAGTLTGSADRLSTSATNLSGLAQGTLAQMEQIVQGAEAQREQMRVAAEVAAGIAAALRQGAQQAGEVGQAAQGTQAKLESTARVVAVLDREAAEVQTITAVIEQFARETHMLSLNAAIEARRAGEAGRGFAAVSDEMRALAERSARSASEVARFGARAQAEMESVGQAVDDVQEAVAQTADFAGQTVSAARQQEQDTSTLADIVEQAATVSDTQAQIAEQVSTAVAEQADAIAELASAAQELAGMAGQLESMAARFVTPQEQKWT